MGATTTATVASSGTNAEGPLRLYGPGMNHQAAYFQVTMSSSYATGGDTVTLPSDFRGQGDFVALFIANPVDATRIYTWDGGTATPKIKAFTAVGTEVTATTNLSTVVLYVLAILK